MARVGNPSSAEMWADDPAVGGADCTTGGPVGRRHRPAVVVFSRSAVAQPVPARLLPCWHVTSLLRAGGSVPQQGSWQLPCPTTRPLSDHAVLVVLLGAPVALPVMYCHCLNCAPTFDVLFLLL